MPSKRLQMALLLAGCTVQGSVEDLAGQCASCHVSQATAFATSAHAVSASTVGFLNALPDASCAPCHQPAFSDAQGMTCTSCHAARGRLDRPGALLHDPTGPPRGGSAAPHALQPAGFVADNDLCITCHTDAPDRTFQVEEPAHGPEGPGGTCVSCHLQGHAFARSPAHD